MLWCVCLFNYADRQAIYSVFPLLKSEMKLSDIQLGIVGGSFMWVYAAALPFDDDSFDLVVCQFGVMFFPDKVKGNSEARRVLRNGGRYLLVVWDSVDQRLNRRPVWIEKAEPVPLGDILLHHVDKKG